VYSRASELLSHPAQLPSTMESNLTSRFRLPAFLILGYIILSLFLLIHTSHAHSAVVSTSQESHKLPARGEVNPISPKHQTHPDDDMPGLPDFNVIAKDKLSVWDDERLSLMTTRYMPGIYQARVGVANG
jgi:hypothetical protein